MPRNWREARASAQLLVLTTCWYVQATKVPNRLNFFDFLADDNNDDNVLTIFSPVTFTLENKSKMAEVDTGHPVSQRKPKCSMRLGLILLRDK
jgi:hypothetical protein